MQNYGSIYGTNLDPEILEILAETEPTREENPALIGIAEQKIEVANTIKVNNEQAIQTTALDSKGNLLHVGDKVIIGNDKSIGRIVALGRHAKVVIPNEGTFEFPCSVLELYVPKATDESINTQLNATYQKAYQDATLLLQPGGSKALVQTVQEQPKVAQHIRAGQAAYEEAHIKPGRDPKFESYDLTTMMKASIQEDDDFGDVVEANARLSQMFEGQPFQMNLKQ